MYSNMKLKLYFSPACMLTALFCLALILPATAQSGAQKAPTGKATKATATTTGTGIKTTNSTPYCDELLPIVKKSLSATANDRCATQQTACECIERKSGLLIQGVVTVQPTELKCIPVPVLSPIYGNPPGADAARAIAPGGTSPTSTAPKAIDPQPVDPAVQWRSGIMQSNCVKSGTSLEVYISGYNLATCDKDRFTISWESDGRQIGSGKRVECICGKTVKVTIKEVATGATSTHTVQLNSCPGGGKE
jgi:hypothetical protein